MSIQVTVPSAHSTTVTLTYDSGANALLAQYVASAIQNGISNTATIVPFVNPTLGPIPTEAPGKVGELVLTSSPVGMLNLPKGYDYLVDAAITAANVTDANVDSGQEILVGSGNLVFSASAGSGSVIGGGGTDQIGVPASNAGSWLIALGGGNDTVRTLGSGADTINLGSGHNIVATSGATTINGFSGGPGAETVTASGTSSDWINGNSSNLLFIAGLGATVFGGSGSDTIQGGTGPDYFQGGSAGNNSIVAGSGAATLFGGGSGDQLFAHGVGAQSLTAAGGNETLYSAAGSDTLNGTVSGAHDTFVGGTGATTVTSSNSGNNLFQFVSVGASSATELVQGLTDVSQIHLNMVGFGANNLSDVTTQNNNSGNLNVVLKDGTQVTFIGITGPLTSSNFPS